ncbi:MAG TPA: hypothetical protein VII55_02210 [Candidatus Saccharimonadales bacterium]
MEVTSPVRPKQLSKHAIPVIAAAAVVLVVSAFALNGYKGLDTDARSILAKSFVTRILHVRPNPHGFARVTFGASAPGVTSAGLALQAGPAQTGNQAQLSLNLQAQPNNQ